MDLDVNVGQSDSRGGENRSNLVMGRTPGGLTAASIISRRGTNSENKSSQMPENMLMS